MLQRGFWRPISAAMCAASLSLCAPLLWAREQQPSVAIQVEIRRAHAAHDSGTRGDSTDAGSVVVWLKPLDSDPPLPHAPRLARLDQYHKSFDPHVLVVEVGSIVQFPNRDLFFHNVFSLFNGKRFDLGLYEAGTSHSVHFDRAGVSFLFCNIHPEMSAVVIAVDTPYYGISDRSGRIAISGVPSGRYELHVWYERSLPEDLQALTRTVNITDSTRAFETIRLTENPNFTFAHKNKFGQDYVPPPDTTYPQR